MADVTLVGFASLPADTFAEGPPSGNFITGNTNGRTIPFPSQPVQGFSGVQLAEGDTFWFLTDNGFGSQANSADYLLRIYRLDPNFRGTEAGDGSVEVLNFIQFSDPNEQVPFEIINENTSDRLLTGADFDVESFVLASDGTIWVGDEFGPFLLHFDSEGQLLEPPIPTPNIPAFPTPFVRAPQNPFLAEGEVANLGGSLGFEGMAISPDKTTLYPLLEGTVADDPPGSLRLYEYDLVAEEYVGLAGFYQLADPNNNIGDLTVINSNEYLVIERDDNQGPAAEFKKIFKIDLSQIDENGFVAKEEVVDLLNIQDPNDLNQDGSTTFTFPFVTIEDVLVLDENTILVANDNNYPFSIGRPPAIDNNEIIILELDQTLDLTPTGNPGDDTLFGGASDDQLYGGEGNNTLFGGEGNNTLTAGTGNDLAFAGAGDDVISLGNGNNIVYGGAGANRILTGNGDDLIYGGADDDIINAGDGNNTIYAGAGANRILTGAGNSSIYTGAGSDTIYAGAGDDLIYAGDGSNIIAPGTGNDMVYGGKDSDLFILDAGDGAATIYSFSTIDRISLGTGFATDASLTFAISNDDTLVSVGDDLLATLKSVRLSTVTVQEA